MGTAPRWNSASRTGTWTTDTTSTYEYQVSTVQLASAIPSNVSPSAGSSAWTTIGAGGAKLAQVGIASQGQVFADAKFSISVRKVGTTTPMQTFVVELDTENGD